MSAERHYPDAPVGEMDPRDVQLLYRAVIKMELRLNTQADIITELTDAHARLMKRVAYLEGAHQP